MFYESIAHRSVPVASAEEAATRIHEGACSFDAFIWTAGERRLAAVADGGLDHPWKEVAVLDLNRSVQIESITFGWIETIEEKIRYLIECETTEFQMRPTTLPLDGDSDSSPAMFTCSCCGEWFTSTIEEQRVLDQDEGYGRCPSCLQWIGGRI